MKIKFTNKRELERASEWLNDNVSPLKYYLHDGRVGGADWRYNSKTYELEVDDARQMTMMLLRFNPNE